MRICVAKPQAAFGVFPLDSPSGNLVKYQRGGYSFPTTPILLLLRNADPFDALELKNPSHTSTRDAGFSLAGLDR